MTIDEILRKLGVAVAPPGHHHSRPGWIQSDCPYCSPNSQRFRLGWNLRGGYATCWMCRRVPTGPTLVRLSGRLSGEIRSLTAELVRDVAQPAGDGLGGIRRDGTCSPPPGVGPLGSIQRKWLLSRGFSPDAVADEWKLGGVNERGGRYAHRLYIPVYLGAEVVSWTTRAVAERDRRRYDSAPADREAVAAKTLLYGEEKCGHAVLVVEGPPDVWAVGPGAVCTLGSAVSRAQVRRLARFPVRVICLDAEPAAQAVAAQIVKQLEVFDGRTVNVLLETGKDPSRCSARELDRLKRMLT